MTRKHLTINTKRRKDYYDLKSNLHTYEVYDKVCYLHETRKEGISPKYTGPLVERHTRIKFISNAPT
jgi:hypothetical protein